MNTPPDHLSGKGMDIPQAIQEAIRHHQAGRLAQAEYIYRQVLIIDPDQVDANHYMGTIGIQTGNYDVAIQFLRKTIRTAPEFAEPHNKLGIALKDAGMPDEAVKSMRNAIALDPGNVQFHFNMGIALLESGNPGAAIESLQNTIALNPDFAPAYYQLGNAFQASGLLDDAIESYEKALEHQPGMAEACLNMGIAFKSSNRPGQAAQCYLRAIQLRPNFCEAHYNLGLLAQDVGQLADAIIHYENALAAMPHHAQAHCNLGTVLDEFGKLDQVISHYRKAIELKPDFAQAHANLGNALKQAGDLGESVASYRKALEIEPGWALVHKSLSDLVDHATHPADVIVMETLYNRPGLPGPDRMLLGFGLGKAYSDLERYDDAMGCLLEANRLKRSVLDYDFKEDRHVFERIKQTFSPPFFAQMQDSGFPDNTPVLIVGMPRSGTSLVEQILASHLKVHGAGECTFLEKIASRFSTDKLTPETVPSAQNLLEKAGQDYVVQLRAAASADAEFITDKQPHNFLYIGLLRLILPRAKVIHCRRDPMDTCFSIYKHLFGKENALKYAYDMEELGRFYVLYQGLMAHWDAVLPGFVYHIDYERLVGDQEGESRKLLEFCKLPWDAACLSFHTTRRPVATASAAQVRKPIYKSSVRLWKHFEHYLDPLKKSIYGSSG